MSGNNRKNKRGFTILGTLIVVVMAAGFVFVFSSLYLYHREFALRKQDIANQRAIREVLDSAYRVQDIQFTDQDACLWIFVTDRKVLYRATDGTEVLADSQYQDFTTEEKIREMFVHASLVSGTTENPDDKKLYVRSRRVNRKTSRDGWDWYCVAMKSDGSIRSFSGINTSPLQDARITRSQALHIIETNVGTTPMEKEIAEES